MTPKMLIPTIQLMSSSLSSAKRPTLSTPALLTRMLQVPCRSVTSSGSSAIRAGSATSARCVLAMASRSSMACRVVASPSVSRSTRATAHPRSARSRAVARPMPLAAPVMTATRPLRSLIVRPSSPVGGVGVVGRLGVVVVRVGLASFLVLDEVPVVDRRILRSGLDAPFVAGGGLALGFGGAAEGGVAEGDGLLALAGVVGVHDLLRHVADPADAGVEAAVLG